MVRARVSTGEAELLREKAELLLNLGNHVEALRCLRPALDSAITCDTIPIQDRAAILTVAGDIYRDRGLLDNALEYYTKAKRVQDSETAPSPEHATLLVTMRDTREELGEIEEAQEHEQQLKRLLRSMPAARESDFGSATLANLHRATGDRGKALKFYKMAIDETKTPWQRAVLLHNMGWLLVEEDDLDEALDCFGQALEICAQICPTSDLIVKCLLGLGDAYRASHNPALVFQAMCQLHEEQPEKEGFTEKEIRRKTGKFGEALTYYARAAEVIESIRVRTPWDIEISGRFFGQHSFLFEHTIDVLHQMNDDVLAFEYAERMKARTMTDLLWSQTIQFGENVDGQLLKAEEELRGKLAKAHQTLSIESQHPSPDQAKLHVLDGEVTRLERRLIEFSEAARETEPDYAALRYADPMTANDLQAKLLDEHTVLIEYVVAEAETYVWAVTSDSIEMFTLRAGRADLHELVEFRFRENLAATSAASQSAVVEALHELWDICLRPVSDTMHICKRVVICPDGPLSLLPFEALIIEPGKLRGKRSPFDSCSFLGEKRGFSYAPSGTTLTHIRDRRRRQEPAHSTLIAFGDPIIEESAVRRECERSPTFRELKRRLGASFEPIPGTRDEVRSIFRAITGKGCPPRDNHFRSPNAVYYLGERATKERVLDECDGYRYVHFATHAVCDDMYPLNSALLLSLGSESTTTKEEALLFASEVFGMRLNAELVTLSACDTGRGRLEKGEGLLGLSRAFMFAGAACVVASLWPVADRRTARLMKAFYGAMASGKDKSTALFLARRAVLKETRNPYYWAPFVLLGDWS